MPLVLELGGIDQATRREIQQILQPPVVDVAP